MTTELKKKIIESVFKGEKKVDAILLLDVIESYEKIQQEIFKIHEEELQLMHKHKLAIGRIEKDMAAVRVKCNHPVIEHHGDPSGGSDSSNECKICGKDLTVSDYRRS